LDNFVPKIGINSDVDLGEYNIVANNLYGINTGDETKSSILSKLSFPTEGEGFLYQTEEGEFLLDNTSYLTSVEITKSMVEEVLVGNITSHTHNYLSSITKADVETVLTGVITSHQHNYLEAETDPLFQQYLATVILEPSANNKVPTSKVIAEYVTDYVTTQFANYQTSNPTLASISALGAETSSIGILQKTDVDT